VAKPDLAQVLFAPRSVALVGASADRNRTTSRPQRYLASHGYKGRVKLINPNRESISGLPCYPDLKSAGPVDHAFILLAGEAALDALAQCAALGIPCATMLAGGFADTGARGRKLQDRLAAIARDGGVRLVGPNSIGVINTHNGLALSVNAVLDAPRLVPGRLGVISHSGSLIGALLSRGQARGLAFSKLVSVGNEADLTLGEVGELLVDDPETDAILLFLETIRAADRVRAMARRAHRAGKPVIAYKLGRSEVGRVLAKSHTGALAGVDEAMDAFLHANGIARVGLFDSLIETPPMMIGRKPPRSGGPSGGKVAVLTTSGGGGAMVVDCLGALGVPVATTPPSVRRWFARHNIPAGAGRLMDLTLAGTDPEIVGGVLDRLMKTPGVAAVVVVVGSSAQFHPELAVAPLLGWANAAKPLAVQLVPEAGASLARLAAAGIAAFRTPEACADGIAAFLRRRPPVPAVRRAGGLEAAGVVLSRSPGGVLDAARSLALFNSLGIETTPSRLMGGAKDAATVRTRFPAAAKIVSPDIPHKTEAGGIALGIENRTRLAAACRRLLAAARKAHAHAHITGILVQPMEAGLAEVLVGYRRDPLVGPVVTVGIGGVLAEISRDTVLAMAPVSIRGARQMIAGVKGLAPLRGYRNLPRGDLDALARAVVAVSNLALVGGTTVLEAEINPLMVRAEGRGVVAVDGLVVLDG
jgi:acyl-CoA synthetase (NDP forming)